MSNIAKRFFWLKLPKDFFESIILRKLKKMSDKHALVYIQLLLASVYDQGNLRIEGLEDTAEEELALLIGENDTSVVYEVVETLRKAHLIEESANNIYLTDMEKLIGSETDSAERMRKKRENNKSDTNVQNSDTNVRECDTDIQNSDTDKIREDIDKNRLEENREDKIRSDNNASLDQSSSNQSNQKINYGTYQNIPLSGSEIRQLKDEFPTDWLDRINAVSAWVKEKNAKCNNFLETLRKWELNKQLHNLQQPQDSTKFNGYEQRNYDEEDLDEVVRKNTERLERQERAKLEALAEAEAEQAKPPTVSDDKPPDKSDHFNLSDEDYKEMVDIMRSFDLDPEQYPEECSKFTIKDSCKFVQWCNKEHKRQMETA